MLRTTLGAGAALAVSACGTNDVEVLAGRVAVPATNDPAAGPEAQAAASAPDTAFTGTPAVEGEMVVAFTYTMATGGKLENPYVAVWIEDQQELLIDTVALFFEQRRRGVRWLDHLDRWFDVDAERIAAGGLDTAATISSATREPGTYTVAWDGLADGAAVPAGRYYVCIESVREDGPYSLIREPFDLTGSLRETLLPDVGELSAASVRIDV